MIEKIKEKASDILIFQSEDGQTRIDVRLDGHTVWLTQVAIAELYQTSVPNINMHIKNILEEGELKEKGTIKNYLIVRDEGTRKVKRNVKHYNLETIIAVGYRVSSHRGTQFRRWATERLREFLVKGFVMDDERLKEGRVMGACNASDGIGTAGVALCLRNLAAQPWCFFPLKRNGRCRLHGSSRVPLKNFRLQFPGNVLLYFNEE